MLKNWLALLSKLVPTLILGCCGLSLVTPAPAQEMSARSLTNDDVRAMVERRVPPTSIISQIQASPGDYIFGGKAELQVRNALLLTTERTYFEAIDLIFAAMYAKMNQTPDMALREKKLPIRNPALPPLTGQMPLGADVVRTSLVELHDGKTVFVWSSHVLARDKIIKAMIKDGRFTPVFDARYADFIINLNFTNRNVSRQTDSGGAYELCMGEVCTEESYGPSYENIRNRNAEMGVFYYVRKGPDTGKCTLGDPELCRNFRGLEYAQRLVYFNVSSKDGGLLGRTHPIDALLNDFLKRHAAMMASPRTAKPGQSAGMVFSAQPIGQPTQAFISGAIKGPVKFKVDATRHSFNNGEGDPFRLVTLKAGEKFSIRSSTNDLWSGDSYRSGYSDANGLVRERIASTQDDSGQTPGYALGAIAYAEPFEGFRAPLGALVGRINGKFKLIGASFNAEAWDSGVLELFYWDMSSVNNGGDVTFTFARGATAQ